MNEAENIEFICPDCISVQIQNFNSNLPDVKPGDHVKAAFKTVYFDQDQTGVDDPSPVMEHMWVEVSEVLDDGYIGRLDNEPFWCDLKLHEQVRVYHSQCSQHLPH